MPTLVCPDLGPFEFREEEILDFPQGLPAFETLKRFLLARKDELAPFLFLISADAPAVRFICVPVGRIDPGYRFELMAGEGAAVGLADGVYSAAAPDPLLLAIVTLPGTAPATVNLASPVVIDTTRRVGVQVILPSPAYSHVMPLNPHPAREAAC